MHEALTKVAIDLKKLAASPNINELLTAEQVEAVGQTVAEGYRLDRQSRFEWERKNADGFRLALQVREKKSFPFENASNVKHPLITIATLQWSSRAYAGLIKPPNIARCAVVGKDPDGAKADRAKRISEHLNYQVIEQDEAWEEEHDQLFMTLPISGCSFIKSAKHPIYDYPVGEHVLATDLVMNYRARSVMTCRRKTHRFQMAPNEIRERQLAGNWSDTELGRCYAEPEHYDPTRQMTDQREGMARTEWGVDRTVCEQHCWFDFDGDGYEEPYMVTFDLSSAKVLNIVNRFKAVNTEQSLKIRKLTGMLMSLKDDQVRYEAVQKKIVALTKEDGKIVSIEPNEHFTKYGFIPSPDGSIYDLGFGALLGPINESVDTLINELIDSGKLQNQNSGWIASGVKIPGGRLSFEFGEWKKVDVTGGSLKENIVPLPVNPPSPVLLELLGVLIQYGEKTASVSDAMTGQNPGQNTPAYGWQQMLTQGMAVYSGIFKRQYRGLRHELRIRYRLNSEHLNPVEYFSILDGQQKEIFLTDYMGPSDDIRPVADPNVALSEERVKTAMFIAERAAMTGGYDPVKVEVNLLDAMQVDNRDEIFPLDEKGQPKITPPKSDELQIETMKEQRLTLESEAKVKLDQQDLQIKAAHTEAMIEEINARIVKTYADAGKVETDSLQAQAKLALDRVNASRQAAKDIGELLIKARGNNGPTNQNGAGGVG
jgi:chaperonin GroES